MSKTQNITTQCGLVALVGAPNVGKSSLLNALVGQHVGIVSPRANTTRLVVRGVVSHNTAQVVFVDTPGLNTSSKSFDRMLVQHARGALEDADVVALVLDAAKGFDARARDIMNSAKDRKHQKMVLILNKIDTVQPRSKLLALMTEAQEAGLFSEVFAVSATKETREKGGLKDILPRLARLMPESPWLFPPEQTTDMPLPLRLAEMTREQAMRHLREELPYSVAVLSESIEEPEDKAYPLEVNQRIVVARETHKGMVVGAGGQMLKSIGSAARETMQEVLGRRVRLNIVVRVEENWAERQGLLNEMGLREG